MKNAVTVLKMTAAMVLFHMRRSAVSGWQTLFPIQKTAWKAGESELICLHGGLRLCRLAWDEGHLF